MLFRGVSVTVMYALASSAWLNVTVSSVPVVHAVPVVRVICPPRSLPKTVGVPGVVPAAAPADTDGARLDVRRYHTPPPRASNPPTVLFQRTELLTDGRCAVVPPGSANESVAPETSSVTEGDAVTMPTR